MDIKELRIGNTVWHEDRGIINVTIDDIAEEECHIKGFLTPLKLTEEYLLKAGFKKQGLNTYAISSKNGIIEYEDGLLYIGGDYSSTNRQCFKVKIKYIHKLQNLYYELEDKEL